MFFATLKILVYDPGNRAEVRFTKNIQMDEQVVELLGLFPFEGILYYADCDAIVIDA